jgi:ribosomal protein S18 acetylase RimI-like enzyme
MTNEVEYSIVTSAPIEEVVALYQAGGWWQESPENRRRIEPMIRGSFCFMVARVGDGGMVGMARIISDGASDAYIQDVVVFPSHRGRGIGGELIRRLTEHCLQCGIGWIGLVAEPGTTKFYESLGYAVIKDYQPMLYGK